MRAFEDFVLGVPYLFMRRIPYCWLPIVAFWTWPPYVSGIFILLLLLGLGGMLLQQIAWERKIQRDQKVFLRDQPRASLWYQLRNLSLVLLACATMGWLFDGRFELSAFQWTILLAGLMITYVDHRLFGRGVVYLVTDKGIAVRYVPGHIDFRLFFRYDEIKQIMRIHAGTKPDLRWNILNPLRKVDEGILLVPNSPDGFSKWLYKVFLSPTDIEKFLQAIPESFVGSTPRPSLEPAWDLAATRQTS